MFRRARLPDMREKPGRESGRKEEKYEDRDAGFWNR